jgi:hypothetical protein
MKRFVVLILAVTLIGVLGGQAATAAKVRRSTLKVALLEFSITTNREAVPPGKVTFIVRNKGTVTHELVLVKGTPSSLPIVNVATPDRSVGAVDEEAIPEAATMGETGDVKAGKTAKKTFKLAKGDYVMFCNIDDKNADGTVTNHFHRGMQAILTVQ